MRKDSATSVTNAAATTAATAIARRFKPVAAVKDRISDVAGLVEYTERGASRNMLGICVAFVAGASRKCPPQKQKMP
jgi:hypothetical protein